jgi:hypothetical protein
MSFNADLKSLKQEYSHNKEALELWKKMILLYDSYLTRVIEQARKKHGKRDLSR